MQRGWWLLLQLVLREQRGAGVSQGCPRTPCLHCTTLLQCGILGETVTFPHGIAVRIIKWVTQFPWGLELTLSLTLGWEWGKAGSALCCHQFWRASLVCFCWLVTFISFNGRNYHFFLKQRKFLPEAGKQAGAKWLRCVYLIPKGDMDTEPEVGWHSQAALHPCCCAEWPHLVQSVSDHSQWMGTWYVVAVSLSQSSKLYLPYLTHIIDYLHSRYWNFKITDVYIAMLR